MGLKHFKQNYKGASLRFKMKELRWQLKYAWQRAWRGYDDVSVFSTFTQFLEWVVPVLKDMHEHNVGSWPKDHVEPGTSFQESFMTFEETQAIISELIYHFERCDENFFLDQSEDMDYKELHDKLEYHKDKALDLFKKYFYCLWY